MSNIYLTSIGSGALGALQVPALPGSGVRDPMNYVFPPVSMGTIYQYIYARDLSVPAARMNVLPNATCFTAAILNSLINQNNNDLEPTGGYTSASVWDGSRGRTLSGAKLVRMVVRAMKRQPLAWEMDFVGIGTADYPFPAPAIITTAQIMGWQAYLVPGTGAVGKILGFTLEMNFNTQANEELKTAAGGTAYPSDEVNQSPPLVRCTLEMPTDKAIPNDINSFGIALDLGTDVTFTINNPLNENPNDVGLEGRRSTRRLAVICRGKSDGTFPVTIA